jgi:uncharacterized protein YdbL (DUF1318 family)
MTKLSMFKAVCAATVLTVSAVAAVALVATPAMADVAASKALVDSAKKQGIVGEKSNGYLGFVKASSDTALKAAVDEINAGRQTVYAQAAAKNGVSAEAAGQATFVNHIQPKLSSGEFYQDTTGNWVKK